MVVVVDVTNKVLASVSNNIFQAEYLSFIIWKFSVVVYCLIFFI